MNSLQKQSGITLVELVILIIVMGIIIPPLASGFSNSSKMLIVKKNLQLAVSESQACAEHILGTRRKLGYSNTVPAVLDSLSDSICDGITHTAEFLAVPLNRTVNFKDASADPSCPGTCASVEIIVDNAGQNVSFINLLLVDY